MHVMNTRTYVHTSTIRGEIQPREVGFELTNIFAREASGHGSRDGSVVVGIVATKIDVGSGADMPPYVRERANERVRVERVLVLVCVCVYVCV
jgi:hypothetical protein